MMLVLAVRTDPARVYRQAMSYFTEAELAEAFAATRGVASPTQLPLARLQRVRPRTLLTIAALAGAFYFVLPQLADVSSSWHALQSAHWV